MREYHQIRSGALWVGGLVLLTILISCGSLFPEVTPMMLASRSGNKAEVQRLLNEGKDVNELSKYGWTSLMFAAAEGERGVVQELLAAGADPNIESRPVPAGFMASRGGYQRTTALREAIRKRDFKIASMLMDRGAAIDQESIRWAGQFGNPAFLAEMKRRGILFQNKEVHGPAFLEACRYCNLPAVRWLSQNGAGPNTSDDEDTALGEAVWGNCPEVVRYLLARGADPNLVFGSPSDKETALFVAVQKHTYSSGFSENLAIISALLSKGAHSDFQGGSEGRTPLTMAIKDRLGTLSKLADPEISESLRVRLKERLAFEEKVLRLLKR